MKRKHMEVRRRIFANDATNKGSISKTHKQLIQLNDKEQTAQLKMGRGLNRHPPKKTDKRPAQRLSIPNCQRRASQNCKRNRSEVPPHTSQSGQHPKAQTASAEVWRKGEPPAGSVRLYTGTVTVKTVQKPLRNLKTE